MISTRLQEVKLEHNKEQDTITVKIVDGRLCFYFSLFTLFYFSFLFYFQNNSGQGLSVTLSHQSQIDGEVTRLITRLERMEQKVLEQSDVIQYGQHMLASCYTHDHLGQGAQQLARTMGNKYIRQTTLYQELYQVLLCHSIQELVLCLTL